MTVVRLLLAAKIFATPLLLGAIAVVVHLTGLRTLFSRFENLVSGMESAGLPDSIQVTSAVYEQAGDRFAFERRGAIDIKGRSRSRCGCFGSDPNLTCSVSISC